MAVIPALVTTYSALGITNLFRNMTNAENAGAATVLGGIHVFNRPLVIALGISALLSFVTALVLATNEKYRFACRRFSFFYWCANHCRHTCADFVVRRDYDYRCHDR